MKKWEPLHLTLDDSKSEWGKAIITIKKNVQDKES